jgi:molybdopterin-guanine dinucleotide biosynthesis protein A
MWPHTVAILIGGQSRRMGSPKHLVELANGNTMFQMMLKFAHTFSERIIILGGEIEGQQCISDLRLHHGPVGGIEAMLHSNIDSKYLVVGCDMPSIREKDVQPFLSCNTNAVFVNDKRILGLPLLIHEETKDACTAYLDSGGRSIKGFVSEIPHSKIAISSMQCDVLRSVNTREDINKLTLE